MHLIRPSKCLTQTIAVFLKVQVYVLHIEHVAVFLFSRRCNNFSEKFSFSSWNTQRTLTLLGYYGKLWASSKRQLTALCLVSKILLETTICFFRKKSIRSMELVLYANLFETIQIFPVQLHSISFALCFVTLCYILHKTSR